MCDVALWLSVLMIFAIPWEATSVVSGDLTISSLATLAIRGLVRLGRMLGFYPYVPSSPLSGARCSPFDGERTEPIRP